jgi:hypothetical protein
MLYVNKFKRHYDRWVLPRPQYCESEVMRITASAPVAALCVCVYVCVYVCVCVCVCAVGR